MTIQSEISVIMAIKNIESISYFQPLNMGVCAMTQVLCKMLKSWSSSYSSEYELTTLFLQLKVTF